MLNFTLFLIVARLEIEKKNVPNDNRCHFFCKAFWNWFITSNLCFVSSISKSTGLQPKHKPEKKEHYFIIFWLCCWSK